MKPDGYPLQQVPRCTARSKRTGLPCCNHPVRGWTVCRMHGARGGAGPGKLNPAYRHGGRAKQAEEMRKMVAELLRESREISLPLIGSDTSD
ncbi:hypothetical protein [Tabrizicola sp.]|uniref:hypothetical protein n=1 Tax=Tabrizicola sp. TaxID=2005166 RepID=UPI001A5D5CC3|nr:hypothetical protein [Tabrizicola sp.]MBL9075752.1 hypothetical protein [Tabrizicola sp.]